jgi:hypothetical protein
MSAAKDLDGVAERAPLSLGEGFWDRLNSLERRYCAAIAELDRITAEFEALRPSALGGPGQPRS